MDSNNRTLLNYRNHTYRSHINERLKSISDAIQFVNDRGFVFFWPIKGIILPSLWIATAGNRPVPDKHDDPGHITWRWKDELLGSDQWYYAKIIQGKSTIISLEVVPNFYALSENIGSIEEDHLYLYEQGRMTAEAKTLYQAILDNGPLNTITLKKLAHLTTGKSESKFNRAIIDLQKDFKIMPIRISDAGSWHYAFEYEITARYFPDLLERSKLISEFNARTKLLELYFLSVGSASRGHIKRVFKWVSEDIDKSINKLCNNGLIHQDNGINNLTQTHFSLSCLFD